MTSNTYAVHAKFHYGNALQETATPVTSINLFEAVRAVANVVDPASGSRLTPAQVHNIVDDLINRKQAEHGWITFTLVTD